MDLIGRGIVAGFAATLFLSAFIEPLAVLARVAGVPTFGWLLHLFLGGCVWGAGFALVHDSLGGPSWVRGVVFVTVSSAIVALLAGSVEGVDFFPREVGPLTATVLLDAIYGAALGGIYAVLAPESGETHDGGRLDSNRNRLGSALR